LEIVPLPNFNTAGGKSPQKGSEIKKAFNRNKRVKGIQLMINQKKNHINPSKNPGRK